MVAAGCSAPGSVNNAGSPADAAAQSASPRNIILFIADGCGPASFTLARDFVRTTRGVDRLVLDEILVGSVKTYAVGNNITDSASSATAYACGVKTRNGMIGLAPDSTDVETLVDLAHARGMSTGLVATSRITHATPAAFSSHVVNRVMEQEIAAQQISSGIALLLGGGRRFFEPSAAGGSRTDGRDLIAEARDLGYTVVGSADELRRLRALPALGLLTHDHLPYEIDRNRATKSVAPSLAEMTAKAIELLSADEDGFFLMVEGSRIDHAAHMNDLGAHLREILAYDEAVGVGLDFASRDGSTLVVSVSDHETGGLTIGRSVAGRSEYWWDPNVAGAAAASHDTIRAAIFERNADPASAMLEYAGIEEMTWDEVEAINGATSSNANAVLGAVVGSRAHVGWTTTGHTAVDVNLYAFGPGAGALTGQLDNAELGRRLAGFIR